MSAKVVFDVLFSDWKEKSNAVWAPFQMSALRGHNNDPGKDARMPEMSMVCCATFDATILASASLVQLAED